MLANAISLHTQNPQNANEKQLLFMPAPVSFQAGQILKIGTVTSIKRSCLEGVKREDFMTTAYGGCSSRVVTHEEIASEITVHSFFPFIRSLCSALFFY